MKIIYLVPVFLFLLVFGCLDGTADFGLTTPDECGERTSLASEMECYHLAAVSMAYVGDGPGAQTLCNNIILIAIDSGHITGYPPHIEKADDLGKKALAERNTCLYDVAKIYARKDPGAAMAMCDSIEDADFGWKIAGDIMGGAPITKDLCTAQVESMADLNFETYHEHGICAIVFIFPLLLLAIFIRR